MLSGEVVEGKLTKKQERLLASVHNIIIAFHDERNKRTERTWNDLLEITGLSKGALSKHLKELVRQGVIKGIVRVYQNRLTTFFQYTGKFFRIKGKRKSAQEIPGNVCRIWFNVDKGIVAYQWGYMKKGKYGSKHFASTK